MKRTIVALLAAAGLLLVAVGPATAQHSAGASAAAKKKAKTVKIKVFDNYYTPPKTTIRVGDTLSYQWPDFSDTHDVALKKGDGPKGVKPWQSPSYGGSDAVWKKKFTVPGTYHLVCTFHDTMTMTVKVTK